MNFVRLARIVRRRWYVIVITTVLGVILGVVATNLQTPEFAASTKQLFTVRTVDGQEATGSEDLMKRMPTYATLVQTTTVLDPVAAQFQIPGGGTALVPRVDSVAPDSTLLLQITVADNDGTRVAQMANAVADSLSATVGRLSAGSEGTGRTLVITTVQPATPPAAPSSPSLAANVVYGLVAGLILGLLVLAIGQAAGNRGSRAPDEPGGDRAGGPGAPATPVSPAPPPGNPAGPGSPRGGPPTGGRPPGRPQGAPPAGMPAPPRPDSATRVIPWMNPSRRGGPPNGSFRR